MCLYSRTDLSNSESEEPRPKACEPRYGGAEPGDRTMIDALSPVLDSLLLDEIIIIMDGRELKHRASRCWRALSPLATISGNDLGKRLPRLQRQASYHGGGGGDLTLGKVKHQQTINNNKQFQGKLEQRQPRR